jgi:hypothetical protein
MTAEAMESDNADAADAATAKESFPRRVFPIVAAVGLSVALTLLLGAFFPATSQLSQYAQQAALTNLNGTPAGR